MDSPHEAVIPDSSRPVARLDMRPAAVETPTVEADIVPDCLVRLTLILAQTKAVASSSRGYRWLLNSSTINYHVLVYPSIRYGSGQAGEICRNADGVWR